MYKIEDAGIMRGPEISALYEGEEQLLPHPKLRKLKQEAQTVLSQSPKQRGNSEHELVISYLNEGKAGRKRYMLSQDFITTWLRFMDKLKESSSSEDFASLEK